RWMVSGKYAADASKTSKSITGLAASPGTDVLPTCSIADTIFPSSSENLIRNSSKRIGHCGSYFSITRELRVGGTNSGAVFLSMLTESADKKTPIMSTRIHVLANSEISSGKADLPLKRESPWSSDEVNRRLAKLCRG